jgi:hypothetical protein
LRINFEKATILVLIAGLIMTSVGLLIAFENGTITVDVIDPISREEAIERSKDSELVREGLVLAHAFGIDANYHNSSGLEQLRKWHSDKLFENVSKDAFWEERVPKGHAAWEIIWWFSGDEGSSAQGYDVIVIVDAKTTRIIFETLGDKFL